MWMEQRENALVSNVEGLSRMAEGLVIYRGLLIIKSDSSGSSSCLREAGGPSDGV